MKRDAEQTKERTPFCFFDLKEPEMRIMYAVSRQAAFIDIEGNVPLVAAAMLSGEQLARIPGEPGVWARFEYVLGMQGMEKPEIDELVELVGQKSRELIH